MDFGKILNNFSAAFTDNPVAASLTIVALFVLFFFAISAPIFSVLLRISGNGLEESIAIGVSTG